MGIWNIRILGIWNIEILGIWIIEILEISNIGILEIWNIRILENLKYWDFGNFKYGDLINIGILGIWNIRILGIWNMGIWKNEETKTSQQVGRRTINFFQKIQRPKWQHLQDLSIWNVVGPMLMEKCIEIKGLGKDAVFNTPS